MYVTADAPAASLPAAAVIFEASGAATTVTAPTWKPALFDAEASSIAAPAEVCVCSSGNADVAPAASGSTIAAEKTKRSALSDGVSALLPPSREMMTPLFGASRAIPSAAASMPMPAAAVMATGSDTCSSAGKSTRSLPSAGHGLPTVRLSATSCDADPPATALASATVGAGS